MQFEYRRKINYYETDRMGVVHHSNYIRYLEEARSAWMEALDHPMPKLEAENITIPALEVDCKYKHHVTFGDTLIIKPKVSEFNGVRMTVTYDVRDLDGNVVIEAFTKHCFTKLDTLRPLNLKKADPDFYAMFESLLSED